MGISISVGLPFSGEGFTRKAFLATHTCMDRIAIGILLYRCYMLSKKQATVAAFSAVNDDESFTAESWRNIAGGETVAARIDEHSTIWD